MSDSNRPAIQVREASESEEGRDKNENRALPHCRLLIPRGLV